jgi:phenylalanyl-tRNA synthetase beta chain
MCELLGKMSLKTTSKDPKSIDVTIPPTRSDILHACDVMEDVAIAYGYNNVIETVPKASTVAVATPVNKLTDKLRREMAQSGYTEVLAFTLVCFYLINASARIMKTLLF